MLDAVRVNELVDRHTTFALRISAGFGRRYPWLADDFSSDAFFALFRAAQSHDPRSGSFLGFARTRIRWAMLVRLRREKRTNPAAFAPQPAPDLPAPTASVEGREREPSDSLERAEVAALLDRLPPAHRELLTRRVIDGEKLADLGAERGVSGNAVGQQVARVLSELQHAARPFG